MCVTIIIFFLSFLQLSVSLILLFFLFCCVVVVLTVLIVEYCLLVCMMMSSNMYAFVCFCAFLNICRKKDCIVHVPQNTMYTRKTVFDECNFYYSHQPCASLYLMTRQLAWIISLLPISIHHVCSCPCFLYLMPPC